MLNHIELQGYLGRDPELRDKQGQNGPYKSASFSLAVSRDKGDGTDWFPCVVYGKRAEVVDKWFRKGSEILVSGRMESYKPMNDPERTAWIVKVEDFHFTRRGTDSQGAGSATGASHRPQNEAPTQLDIPDSWEDQEEDIPF